LLEDQPHVAFDLAFLHAQLADYLLDRFHLSIHAANGPCQLRLISTKTTVSYPHEQSAARIVLLKALPTGLGAPPTAERAADKREQQGKYTGHGHDGAQTLSWYVRRKLRQCHTTKAVDEAGA
jgi:hypothetical protein